MVKIYVTLINRGKITIDDVPEKWRAAVVALLHMVSNQTEE